MSMKVLMLKPPVDKINRNVVRDFVYGCWCNGRRIGGMQMPPLNELYVSTHARQDEMEVVFLDSQFEYERFVVLVRNKFDGYQAVFIMSSTQSFRSDVQTLSQIKQLNPQIKTILFGSHPTFMPRYCLQEEVVDYIVLREPEETIRCLLKALKSGDSVESLEGIGYRNSSGEIVINPNRPFMDMDELPIPDRRLLPKCIDYFNPVVKNMPYTTMQTSRGCQGKCIFCTAPVFYGKRVRWRSSALILEELRKISRMGYREVFFRDETFTTYKKRNWEICEGMLREGLNLSWIANARVDMIDKETMALMKKAKCHLIKFGVETGNNHILANYKKGTTTNQAEQAFRYAREVGLSTHAHIVFGGPGETSETITKTIAFVKKLRASTASFGILTPYPGTKLFEMVANAHPEIMDGSGSNMETLHVDGFFSERICGMSGEELSKWIVKAYRSFYWRPFYLFERLAKISSKDEFMSLGIAGMNIFRFSVTGEK